MGSRKFNKVGFRDVTPIMENQLEPEMKTGLTFERYDPPQRAPGTIKPKAPAPVRNSDVWLILTLNPLPEPEILHTL